MNYTKPIIETIATFKRDTAGLTVGIYRDVFGGRAIFFIRL